MSRFDPYREQSIDLDSRSVVSLPTTMGINRLAAFSTQSSTWRIQEDFSAIDIPRLHDYDGLLAS